MRTLNSASAIQVYGVDIAINQPLNVMLDGQGLSRFNLKIKYTITPADYQASNALILLYKVIEKNGIKNYELIDNITVEKQGAGYGVIARGYKFEENQNYAVQVALNYSTTGNPGLMRCRDEDRNKDYYCYCTFLSLFVVPAQPRLGKNKYKRH